ncbi:MAG: hypothetical protein ACREL9_12205, partial [Gemmatimonadales bacterium]
MGLAPLPAFAGRGAMALACRLRRPTPGGVIINGHVLTASQARFQVDVLARWFEFIHYDELLERLAA